MSAPICRVLVAPRSSGWVAWKCVTVVEVIAVPPSSLVVGRHVVDLDLGPVAGEAEEDVVEAGSLQPDVVEVDAGVVEPGRDAGERTDALGGSRDVPRVAVDVDLADLGAQDLGRRVDLTGPASP